MARDPGGRRRCRRRVLDLEHVPRARVMRTSGSSWRHHGSSPSAASRNTLSYGISQKENPGLTINTTPTRSRTDSPVTLSGNLALGAGKTVDAAGAHVRWGIRAGHKRHDGLRWRIQVRRSRRCRTRATALSAARQIGGAVRGREIRAERPDVPQSTVVSGQPLTFAGRSRRRNVGKIVYLEREDRFGGGFHVVDVGSVLQRRQLLDHRLRSSGPARRYSA